MPVTLLCAAALTIFFADRHITSAEKSVPRSPLSVNSPSKLEGVPAGRGRVFNPLSVLRSPLCNSEPLRSKLTSFNFQSSTFNYYSDVASQFLGSLPDDKEAVAVIIDSTNHHIIYVEKNDVPSCYLYDLETLTTRVLFGGEYGFYCGTKLVIAGHIDSWRRYGSTLFFIAGNRAPEVGYANAAMVFSLDVISHDVSFLDYCAKATFVDSTHLRLTKARPVHDLPSQTEDVYWQTIEVYEIK